MNVKDAIGDFEFSVAPPPIFHHAGSMVIFSDNSQVASSRVFNLPLPEGAILYQPKDSVPSVLITDAMCIVNMIPKTSDLSNDMHFAMKLIEIVTGVSAPCDEIRSMFDQYLPGFLKETTRNKRTVKTIPIHNDVSEDTELKNIMVFLSHINTKTQFTKYLSDKLIDF